MNLDSWLSTTRRRVLGQLLCGGGAILGACGLASAADRTRQQGRILLGHVPSTPPGLREAIRFPLVEALLGRRSRRFALGCKIPDGPTAYASQEKSLPLSDLEQMLLLTSVAGNTGWQNLIPHSPSYAPDIPNYSAAAGGRTFPSAAGFHTTEFFFTDDHGTYFFPTRDAPSLSTPDGDGQIDLQRFLQAHRERIKSLSNERLGLPPTPEHLEMHNAWCANCPGSTLIIPVADAAQHHLANLCYLVQNGICLYDDVAGSSIPGIEQFDDVVDVKKSYPLSVAEQMTLAEVSVEVSTACYAGTLMLQALGLGGWTFSGLNPFSVLGASGDPGVPGLGFRHDLDERWPLPNVTGLKGVFEGLCPPHVPDMHEAVKRLVARKFGPGGPYHTDTPGPYRDDRRVRSSGQWHSERFQKCVATTAQYIYDRYGRFPATFSSMFTMMYLQAHHLELGYYDAHFGPGAYLRTHAEHRKNWHGR